jgi:hypothetical protein
MRDPYAGLYDFRFWCVSLSGTHCRIHEIFFYIPIWWDFLWLRNLPALLNMSQFASFVVNFETLTNTQPHITHSFISLVRNRSDNSGGMKWPKIAEICVKLSHFSLCGSWLPVGDGDEVNSQHFQSSFARGQFGNFYVSFRHHRMSGGGICSQ